MIIFTKDAELELTVAYDEKADKVETRNEIFKAGVPYDADVFDDRGDSINVQFADGSVIYGLPKSLITVTE